MSELYNTILKLCNQCGITGYKMCKDIGIQPSIMTDLKMGRKEGLSAKNADKIASYFGVSVGYLLGTEDKEKSAPKAESGKEISDDDLMFALWGDVDDIDNDDLDDVKRYAAFVRERKKDKGK